MDGLAGHAIKAAGCPHTIQHAVLTLAVAADASKAAWARAIRADGLTEPGQGRAAPGTEIGTAHPTTSTARREDGPEQALEQPSRC